MLRYVKIGIFNLYQLYFCQLCSRELHKLGKYGLTMSSSLRLGTQAVALAKNKVSLKKWLAVGLFKDGKFTMGVQVIGWALT